MSKYLLSFLLLFPCIIIASEPETDLQIIKYSPPYYIIKINPELNYFVNGDLKVKVNDVEKYNLLIMDVNNFNDSCLAKEDSPLDLVKICDKQKCTGIPKVYETKMSKSVTEVENLSSTYLGFGYAFKNDVSSEFFNLEPEIDYGIGVTYDQRIFNYKTPIGLFALGANVNFVYSTFLLEQSEIGNNYGWENISMYLLSISPSFFYFPFQSLGIFFGPAVSYSSIAFSMDKGGNAFKMESGLAFGSNFGLLIPFDKMLFSIRVINISSPLVAEYTKTQDGAVISESKFDGEINSQQIFASFGFSF